MIPKTRLQLPKCAGIYLITCTANGKIYIGSTNNLRNRWNSHRSQLRAGNHPNQHMQRSWDKHGEESFTMTVLEKCEQVDITEREQHYLDVWKPFDPRGFNMAIDAVAPMRGRKMSPESIAKRVAKITGQKRTPEFSERMSALHKGKKLSEARLEKMRGRVVSDETREKIRKAVTGFRHSDETRAKMSVSRTNPSPEVRAALSRGAKNMPPETRAKITASRIGIKRSPEAIAKTAAFHRGRKLSDEHRAKLSAAHCKYKYLVTLPSGEEVIINNLRDFSLANNLDPATLHRVVCGKQRHHKGYKVRRIE